MIITTRDSAREAMQARNITPINVSEKQLLLLWCILNAQLIESDNYKGTLRMNQPVGGKFMTCKTSQWDKREAVSFNGDGFIGIAGWADRSNIRPFLNGIDQWLQSH